ncbi:MAG: hypothetical protein ACYDEE_15200 [Ignavibacteriaceae bacterium]
MFGSFGFNIPASRLDFNKLVILSGVVINSAITLIVLMLTTGLETNSIYIAAVIIYSVVYSYIGIISFRILFDGHHVRYAVITFIVSISNLLIIPFVTAGHLSISLSLILSAFLALASTHKIINNAGLTEKEKGTIKDLYTVGISAFVINMIVPLALIVDKYIANHYFDMTTANAYTFGWGLTAPMFYIGNLIEKMMYSIKGNDKRKLLKNSFGLLLVFILMYNIMLIAGVNYFTFLLPKSIDKTLLKHIVYFMTGGYSVYVLFQFPVNGYLFKFSKITTQEKIAAVFAVFAVIYTAAMFLLRGFIAGVQFQVLLIAVWIFIFSLLGIKIFLMLHKTQRTLR